MTKASAYAILLLCVLQKIPASLSVIGSSCIVSSVFRSNENKANIQQRIVGGMSIMDTLGALTWLTTNFWLPMSYEFYPATIGNDLSCNIHGFLIQVFDTSSVVYNGGLSIYYLLVIKYGWSDAKLRKLEKWFHLVPLAFGIITAIIPAAFKLYNPANWNCWIATDYKDPADSRQGLVQGFQLAFFYIPLAVTILLSSTIMFIIYLYVRENEMKTARMSAVSSRLTRTKQVARQGMLFVAALVVSWFFAAIMRVIQMSGGTPPTALIVVGGVFAPSQGFLNSITYFRIRASRQMRDNPDTPKWKIVRGIIQAQLFPWCGTLGSSHDDGNDCEANISIATPTRISNASRADHDEVPATISGEQCSSPIVKRPDLPCDWQSLRARGVQTMASKALRADPISRRRSMMSGVSSSTDASLRKPDLSISVSLNNIDALRLEVSIGNKSVIPKRDQKTSKISAKSTELKPMKPHNNVPQEMDYTATDDAETLPLSSK